jgi:hypothetical protein
MLSGWSNFFSLTGSSAASLVGLLFVVVTLGSGWSTSRTKDVERALLTPALYSFTGVLLQSLVALAPWPSNLPAGVTFVILGVGGLIYRLRAVRVRRQVHLLAIAGTMDRIFHNALPVSASLILIAGGAGMIASSASAPFAIAGSCALLLVSGIYRCWGETLVMIGSKDQPSADADGSP